MAPSLGKYSLPRWRRLGGAFGGGNVWLSLLGSPQIRKQRENGYVHLSFISSSFISPQLPSPWNGAAHIQDGSSLLSLSTLEAPRPSIYSVGPEVCLRGDSESSQADGRDSPSRFHKTGGTNH